ncbi:hypothetical protein V6N11_064592 [Hibiscus sabdariffa]|uniref:CRIB domain-containing protein n=1 Tax=Hibiscus sabdariffa TaxID=183260 RepID=A0ABR2ND58_9ROSI
MEIGEPTDVIHVAHIGVDHSSTVAPSWMNEFKNGIDPSMGSQLETERMRNRSCTDLPNVREKRKRRKKSNSIDESSSIKSQRLSKMMAKCT